MTSSRYSLSLFSAVFSWLSELCPGLRTECSQALSRTADVNSLCVCDVEVQHTCACVWFMYILQLLYVSHLLCSLMHGRWSYSGKFLPPSCTCISQFSIFPSRPYWFSPPTSSSPLSRPLPHTIPPSPPHSCTTSPSPWQPHWEVRTCRSTVSGGRLSTSVWAALSGNMSASTASVCLRETEWP